MNNMLTIDLDDREIEIVSMRIDEGKRRLLEMRDHASAELEELLDDELLIHERLVHKLKK